MQVDTTDAQKIKKEFRQQLETKRRPRILKHQRSKTFAPTQFSNQFYTNKSDLMNNHSDNDNINNNNNNIKRRNRSRNNNNNSKNTNSNYKHNSFSDVGGGGVGGDKNIITNNGAKRGSFSKFGNGKNVNNNSVSGVNNDCKRSFHVDRYSRLRKEKITLYQFAKKLESEDILIENIPIIIKDSDDRKKYVSKQRSHQPCRNGNERKSQSTNERKNESINSINIIDSNDNNDVLNGIKNMKLLIWSDIYAKSNEVARYLVVSRMIQILVQFEFYYQL